MRRLIGSTACLLLFACAVKAQSTPDIIEFRNGQITWTNVNPALYYTVEWRPTLTESNWTGSFRGLQDLQSSASTITLSVPMFLRIRGSSNATQTATLSGTTTVVNAGYYAATNMTQVATNLVAGNIRKGVTVLGIVGSLYSSGETNRYWDHGNGTVTDQETGLMWSKNANHGAMTWAVAMAYCENLVTNGYSDWRLPSVTRQNGLGGPMGNSELDTLGRASGDPSGTWEGTPGAPFTGVLSAWYWSSTAYTDPAYAWFVPMSNGQVRDIDKKAYAYYVWPVRGGQ